MALTSMGKVNFWNKLRVERNIRYKDLVDLYGGSNGMWGMYFSGQQLPPMDRIKQMCSLFDVDINEGAEEFRKAHAVWAAGDKKKVLVTGASEKTDRSARIVVGKKEPVAVSSDTPIVRDYSTKDVFKLVYGKIPYELFLVFWELVESAKGDPLECLYGRVSYREFSQISEALRKVADKDSDEE